MQIFIPTLGRADLKKPTVSHIPDCWRQLTHLVVQAHEEDLYRPVAEKHGTELLILPEEIKRIVPTRYFIGEYCKSNEIDSMMMLDDDLEFYIREDQHSGEEDFWKLTAPSEDQIDEMLNQIEEDLFHYVHVGVSGREGNNRVEQAWVENTRYMRLLAYRTDFYMACEHNRVEVMEDFDIALQLLRAGFKNKVHYEYAQGQARTQSAGGCSVWRDHSVHNAGAERLAELHPQFVKVREKQNKTDREGFGTRKEVTVQWKKAFESSIDGENQ